MLGQCRNIQCLERNGGVFNRNDGAFQSGKLALIDAYLVTFHIHGGAASQQGSLDHSLNFFVVSRVFLLLDRDSGLANRCLEVDQLLIGRLDIGTGLHLFEREILKCKSLVEKLVFPVHHVLSQLGMVFDLSTHSLRRSEVEFLRHAGEGPRRFILARERSLVHARHKPHPDLVLTHVLHKRNVAIVGP